MALLGGVAQLAGGADPQKLDDSSEGEGQEQGSPQEGDSLKDVFWDRMVVFLTTAIIGLTALDVLTELLRGGSQVACFIPDSLNVTEGQEAYINNFCAQSVPDTQYLPIFILVHGILIAAWHFIWRSSSATHFKYFISLASQLVQLDDNPQGIHPQKNLIIVSKLTSEFRTYKRSRILRWYQVKLLAQIVTALVSLLLTFLVFNDFGVNFECPQNPQSDMYWPLPGVKVQCIFTSLRLFSLLQVVDALLLSCILLALLGALLWSIWRHPFELGPENVALFSFTTSVPSSYYVPKPMLRNLKSFCRRCCSRHVFSEIKQRFFVPRLSTDLDFLLKMLYRTDSGLGHAFKESQVYEEYRQLTDADLQSLGAGSELSGDKKQAKRDLGKLLKWTIKPNIYQNFVQVNASTPLEIPNVMRGAVLGFSQRAPSNTRALEISFGSHGFSTILARVFRHVGSVNFDPAYKDAEKPVVEFAFANNITGFRCHDNIFSQQASASDELINGLESLLSKDGAKDVYKIEYIMVGPMDQFIQMSAAKTLLDNLKYKFVNESESRRTVLLTIVPVSIEGKDAEKQFYNFIPPKHLFKSVHQSVDLVRDRYLPWPERVLTKEEKKVEEESAKLDTEQPGDIQLRSVTVSLEEDPPREDETKLITTETGNGATSSESREMECFPTVCQLQCGNTLCDLKFTLYEFVWVPEVIVLPPRSPSSSSESSKEEEEESGDKGGEKGTSKEKDESSERRPQKIQNVEANVTKEEEK